MEAPPLFPEAPQEDDDDSESSLAKKRNKRFESKDDDKDKPKRISLENLFVREEIDDKKDSSSDITEIFSRKKESSTADNTEVPVAESDALQHESTSEDEQLETLNDDETRYAVEAIATERTENLQQELESVEPGSVQEAEVLAGAAFVENVLDHASQGEVIDEAVLDNAAEEAAQDIGSSLESIPDDSESEDSENDDETSDDTASAGASSSSGATGSFTPPPGSGSVAGSGNGGSTPPPLSGSTPPPAGFPAASLTPAGAIGAPAIPAERASDEHEQQDRHSHVKYVMAGGIVGYMLGRRRGRIKTEARLLPVQKKLENQVEGLTEQIAEREIRLRKLAREQYENHAFDSRTVVERLNEKNEKRAERSRQPMPLTPEQTISSGEHIPAAAAAAEYQRPASERTPEKTVESMKLVELLQVAAAIEINGQSVKSLFESGRIDTPALRRVIKEYMHNGDFKKELMQSMRPEVYESPEVAMERQKATEQQIEAKDTEYNEERPMGHMPQDQYPQLHAADETPQLHTVYQQDNADKSSDMTRKLLIGAGATAAVIILAFIVGGLLLMVI